MMFLPGQRACLLWQIHSLSQASGIDRQPPGDVPIRVCAVRPPIWSKSVENLGIESTSNPMGESGQCSEHRMRCAYRPQAMDPVQPQLPQSEQMRSRPA